MIFWYFLVVVAFIWILFATITDLKTREVPNWLNYSLIAIGLGTRTIYSFITKDFSYILYGLIGFGIFLIVGNIMYYTKQWGGGDSKLLMGLGAVFGNYNGKLLFDLELDLPFLAILVINILICGAIYGVFYSGLLALKNKNKFLINLKNRDFSYIKYFLIFSISFAFVAYFLFDRQIYTLLIVLLFVMFLLIVLLYFMKIVEYILMYKLINVNKVTEGDWLIQDVIKNNKVICRQRNIGLTTKDIATLKKNNIKNVLIKEGIPFVPGFLFGFLLTFTFGDIFLTLIL